MTALEHLVQEREEAAAKAARDAQDQQKKALAGYRKAVHHEGPRTDLVDAAARLGLTDAVLKSDSADLKAHREHTKKLLDETESSALQKKTSEAKEQSADAYRKTAARFFASGDPVLMHSLISVVRGQINWMTGPERDAIWSELGDTMEQYLAAENPLNNRQHEHNEAQRAIDALKRNNPRLFGND